MANILRNDRVNTSQGNIGLIAQKSITDAESQFIVEKDVSLRSVHLDALRGVAAVIVVAGHERGLFFSEVTTGAHDGATIGNKTTGDLSISIGLEAVMVFFVLSGFLVGGSVLRLMGNNIWSWRNYLIRRLTRLWVVLIPALLLGFALDLGGSRLFSGAGSIYSSPPGQIYVSSPNLWSLYTPAILLGNIAFTQNVFVPVAGTNGALWSLTNEFWYYIAFPMLLLGVKRKQAFWKRVAYLLTCAVILANLGFGGSFLFLIWMLGAAVSIMPLRFSTGVASRASLLVTLILAAAFLLVKTRVGSIVAGEAIIGVLSALLIYLILHQTCKAKPGVYRFMSTHASTMSYTLYLSHLPILIFICAAINNPWMIWKPTITNILISVFVFSLNLALAYLLYRLFESNTDRYRRFVSLTFARFSDKL